MMPGRQTFRCLLEWTWTLWVAGALVLAPGHASAEAVRIAYLAAEPSVKALGPHNRGGWEAARALGDATLLLRQGDGSFADPAGEARKLEEFDVLWYHQGDTIRRTALYVPPSLNALRRFAEGGGGVLLSGGALALVAQLGLEGEMRAQRHDKGPWREPAGMVPVEKSHPVFSGWNTDGSVFWLSRGGCRAVADFNWGGPAEGMLLAKTPRGRENPLVEYNLGKGRVIVFGWHWPDYADEKNPHRARLLSLTSNILHYLGDRNSWRSVVLRSTYPPAASPDKPGVAPKRWRALRRAIQDLSASFPDRYRDGGHFLGRLESLRTEQRRLLSGRAAEADLDARKRDNRKRGIEAEFEALKRESLLANPLLDFDQLLVIRRRADRLGLPLNFHGNTDLAPTGYDNKLLVLSPVRPGGKLETIWTPNGDSFIGDLDLHYDGNRLLLSIPDASGRWGIAELDLRSRQEEQLSLIGEPDVDCYDACYLPDGRIVFTSTAGVVGVPCVGGRSKVANLYLREHDGSIRRLTNDQDHNWCPTVLNNGRLLYQRWEYADIAHAFTRLLFHANPDGSRQMEYYGSNSFWPTAMFYARPIPGHPTQVVAVVGGHHDAPRQGELVLFDPARGRFEASGVVQRIPGYEEAVEPVILDGLIGNSWPRFLHPYPLSEKHFLVSCRPTRTSLWGIYLIDVFDNFVLLCEEPGYALLEPIPWSKKPRPPRLPDVVSPNGKEASVLLVDVYRGPGLRGVPRGTVKSLRLFSYEFAFWGLGGEPDRVGFDGPWDVKRILGTVPVERDGSAFFRVPACTPVAIQPLDREGKALALMRSWFTAAEGEVLSCVGCHEPQNTAPPPAKAPLAPRREPSPITPWYGPARGFSFAREVQPVLDAYCVRCHNGQPPTGVDKPFDLTARPPERVPSAFQMRFTPSYMELRRFVHGHTLESDAHILPPRAFHADTSKLIQILRDGHYGVQLSKEAWDRLITWIDLNAPAHGTWAEVVGHIPPKATLVKHGAKRRRELHGRLSGIDEDPEARYPAAVVSAETKSDAVPDRAGSTPPDAEKSAPASPAPKVTAREVRATSDAIRRIAVAEGLEMEFVAIPSGTFSMGSESGYPNESPAHIVTLGSGFWMSRFEVTNRQYQCFDPAHDSGLETGEQYQFGNYERGHRLNRLDQPVVRVSWHQAAGFCRWLSEKTDLRMKLPTEAQWEYACRAGSRHPLSYGTIDDDFSHFANLSDATHYSVDYPHVPTALPPWRPADPRFDDGRRVSASVGSFQPNPWGLFDMHGNVAEWTRSTYLPYPYHNEKSEEGDASYDLEGSRRTVRGGSWLDRPRRARSAFRLHYEASQEVHDVGFRVIFEQ